MNSPRYARLIAEVWKRGEPHTSELPTGADRDDEIELIEQAMEKRRRRSARLRTAAGWAVAAAVALAGASAWRVSRQQPPVASAVVTSAQSKDSTAVASPVAIAIASGAGAIVAAPGSSAPAVAGRALQAGSRLIVAPNAAATLSLSTGTHLEVEPGSQLAVVEDGLAQVFALNAGSLRADVAKLGKGERFIVRTVDAEVEVRGTSFLVDLVASDAACGAGTKTRVTVLEGVVTVRAGGAEQSVGPGEHWPRGCRKSPPVAAATAQGAMNRAAKAEAPKPEASPPMPLAAATPRTFENHAPPAPISPLPSSTQRSSSSLADENNLFAEGMLARRQGNVPLAVERMDRFLERYPTSQLAENAAAERMRLLRALDTVKAQSAARQYLQRFPNGFARGDAEAMLAGSR